jgi:hypothetical protein
MAGQRHGAWTVLRLDAERGSKRGGCYWICRCDCGTEQAVRGLNLRLGLTRGCRKCCWRRGDYHHSPAALVAWAQDGMCSWCKRPSLHPRLLYECGACNRMAMRYGRDAEGRPIARGKRWVVQS